MNRYAITRDKFFSAIEKKGLLKVSKDRAISDLIEGRKNWITRYMLIHLALNTGLRVSEIAALNVGDLHMNGKDNYLIVQNGKGRRKRDVYLDMEIVRHLQEYLEIKEKEWEEAIEDSAPLFSGRGKTHYTTTALEISFKKAIEEAGLPKSYSIHSARHTYATLLLAKTNSLRFVQKQLGHASIAMTSLYADVLPEMNQTLANAILK
jgi:site-specific recombinase XerD